MAFEKGENNYDVIIIGAGISGINAGFRLQQKNPDLTYCILEGRHETGGTWSLFKYPGIRSDSDLYTFGFPWRPWRAHTSIAEGDLIQTYVRESAEAYGIDKKIKFNHKVNSADWSSEHNTWSLDVTHEEKSKTFKARFMMMCTGYYDYDKALTTTIPGIENFKGQVIHPQFWPEDLDYTGKNIVVIGSGATSITLLPNLAHKASHVTMLQRSPSYVLSQPTEDPTERLIRALFSPAWQHTLIRWKWLFQSWFAVRLCLNFPNFMRKTLLSATTKQLPPNLPLDPNFTPRYNPFEQRLCLCPNGDYYAALRSGKASVVTAIIDTVTPDAINLQSGERLKPDIIVTATGLKVQFAGGVALRVDGKPYPISDKLLWKGVLLEDLPNAAVSLGYVDASWTLGADASAQMVCRLLRRMRDNGQAAIVPRRSQAERDGALKVLSPFRLSSTYVEKAQSAIPKAGDRGQWTRRSFYYRDIMSAWYGDIRSNLEIIKAR